MYTIDNLFALPTPLGLLKTAMRPRRSLLPPIITTILIQVLVLVSILAPSALSVAPSEQVPRDMQVPTLNLLCYKNNLLGPRACPIVAAHP